MPDHVGGPVEASPGTYLRMKSQSQRASQSSTQWPRPRTLLTKRPGTLPSSALTEVLTKFQGTSDPSSVAHWSQSGR
eukprot:CAMPEP_0183457124 /NCGR_PEP_ID=MMETSP0370-20130417/130593_1 /TAXON_ID=268820 /ORGANISM="Peridinium aciculiferum, Strain PAER-2" /LENGTH=76 /DNA_ID=CAMNT_0025648827 /DNA_START=38 /DNA_END=265 /DNA_ORIENTATION=+